MIDYRRFLNLGNTEQPHITKCPLFDLLGTQKADCVIKMYNTMNKAHTVLRETPMPIPKA